jgi:hypothetical protein
MNDFSFSYMYLFAPALPPLCPRNAPAAKTRQTRMNPQFLDLPPLPPQKTISQNENLPLRHPIAWCVGMKKGPCGPVRMVCPAAVCRAQALRKMGTTGAPRSRASM